MITAKIIDLSIISICYIKVITDNKSFVLIFSFIYEFSIFINYIFFFYSKSKPQKFQITVMPNCCYCNKVFKDRQALGSHIKTHLDDSDEDSSQPIQRISQHNL